MGFSQSIHTFKQKLDKEYNWPAEYVFKFIVPEEGASSIVALFPNHEPRIKKSSKGNYTSLSFAVRVESSDEVIDLYILANEVDGVIAL